jgi:predicted nuclease with TOPRIM domain
MERPADTAQEEAERRGADRAELAGRLKSQDSEISYIKQSQKRLTDDVARLKETVEKLVYHISEKDKVQEALTDSAKKLQEKQVTAMQLYLALGMFLIALAALLYGSGKFG